MVVGRRLALLSKALGGRNGDETVESRAGQLSARWTARIALTHSPPNDGRKTP